jgi:hypothetical protein
VIEAELKMAERELSLCGIASSANEAEARFRSKPRIGLMVKTLKSLPHIPCKLQLPKPQLDRLS